MFLEAPAKHNDPNSYLQRSRQISRRSGQKDSQAGRGGFRYNKRLHLVVFMLPLGHIYVTIWCR